MDVDLWLKIINLVALIGGAGAILYRLGVAVSRFGTIGKQQALEITILKVDVKAISEVVTKVAVQNQRLDNMAERIAMIDRRMEDLRRGEGFVKRS